MARGLSTTSAVIVLAASNPHKPKSKDHAKFDKLQTGMTVGAIIDAGVDSGYLVYAARRGLIAVEGVDPPKLEPHIAKPKAGAPRPLIAVDKVAIASGYLVRGATVKFTTTGKFIGTVLQVGASQSEVRWETGGGHFTQSEPNSKLVIVTETAVPAAVLINGARVRPTTTAVVSEEKAKALAIPEALLREQPTESAPKPKRSRKKQAKKQA